MEGDSAVVDNSEKTQTGEAGEAAATSRGDDEVLEGVTIGDTIEEVYSSESDEGEEGIVIHAGRTTSRGRPQRKSFGKNMTYTRPDALSPQSLMSSGVAKSSAHLSGASAEEELKKLRFLRHATAFDVDVNVLEDHPWRSKTVDLLDYFNYGFNERTWLIYCEKQLRLRAQKGLGPYQPPPGAPASTIIPPGAASQASASAAPVALPVFPGSSFGPPVLSQGLQPAPAMPPPALPKPFAPTLAAPAPPVFPGSMRPLAPQVNGSFLPPAPVGRPMPPGPPGAPAPPAGPPMAPSMLPPPPLPAGFGPPPSASFQPQMGHLGMGPGMNMNAMMNNGVEDFFHQPSFTGIGGVGPGLDMYGRELAGFDAPSGGGRQQPTVHNERERRDTRDDGATGGKRKFPSSEELEVSHKRRTGSNSRDRGDRDRGERFSGTTRPLPPAPSGARAPATNQSRRDSRDRDNSAAQRVSSRDTSAAPRASNRDSRDRDTSASAAPRVSGRDTSAAPRSSNRDSRDRDNSAAQRDNSAAKRVSSRDTGAAPRASSRDRRAGREVDSRGSDRRTDRGADRGSDRRRSPDGRRDVDRDRPRR